MLGTLARSAYMLIVAAMIVAWILLPSKSTQAEPQSNNTVVVWWC